MAVPLLHVIGGGPWQVPTIMRAQAMGLRVLVTDGYAERPGFAVADLHEVVDITDAEATLAVSRRHGIDGVICDTTDTGVFTAAYVAHHLSLPGVGLEAARRCTDKAAMTACVRAAGVRVPASQQVSSLEALRDAASFVGYPAVVKPVDAQGGRGVRVVYEPVELEVAFHGALTAGRCDRVLVQRVIRGTEIVVDSLVVNGHVHCLGVARKTQYGDNLTVSSRITYGARGLPSTQTEIEAVNLATVHALGIRQGLVHAEFVIDENGPMPIDVAARGGGVMIYPTVLSHVSGVDVMQQAIRMAIGVATEPPVMDHPRAANIEFLRVPPGRIESIDGVATARQVHGIGAVHLFHGVGSEVRPLQDKEDRLGFVIALTTDADQAVALSQQAASMIRVHVAPFNPTVLQ